MTNARRSFQPPIEKQLGEPVIVLHNVSKRYALGGSEDGTWVQALVDISLAPDSEVYPILRGEFVILRGPSGGGKTSLLNLLGCIDLASTGTMSIFGSEVNTQSKDNFLADLRLKKIGFVFQTFNLIATMSAFENVELPMTILGKLSKKERQIRTKELLALVGLQDRMEHLPGELSGGEQQRVTIARALGNEPEVLLLDEPTGDLDTLNTIDVMNLLLAINTEKKTTCVMVTHNPQVECYADRVLFMQDGMFVKQALNRVQTRMAAD